VQSVVRRVFTHADIKHYIAQLVHATRNDQRTLVGSSPRGGIAILALSKAAAVYAGRDFVLPDDVKEVTEVALTHRILMRPEAAARGMDASMVVQDALRSTPTPRIPQVAKA
jgi:MoxR-like ATPase